VVRHPAPREQPARQRIAPGVRELSRPHSAQRTPGRRHAVRRGGRDGAARSTWSTARCVATTASTPSKLRSRRRVIALAPAGRLLDDRLADELAAEPALTLLCGRYEGFERAHPRALRQRCRLDRPAMSSAAASSRRWCSATPSRASFPGRSATSARRRRSRSAPRWKAIRVPPLHAPAEYRGWRVPDVLLSGHHERIAEWRRERKPRTRRRRRRGRSPLRRPFRVRRRRAVVRYHCWVAPAETKSRRLSGRRAHPLHCHEQRHRNHRARSAAPRARLRAGDRVKVALPGDRGRTQPRAGVRGGRHQAPGARRTRDLHRPQAVLRGRRGAMFPCIRPRSSASSSPRGATCAARSSTYLRDRVGKRARVRERRYTGPETAVEPRPAARACGGDRCGA